MFDTFSISREENEFVLEAEKYGEYFLLSNDIMYFQHRFIYEISKEATVFNSFFSQLQKSWHLAYLSILRKHDVQAKLMMRFSLETATLALYSMYHRDLNLYQTTNEDGTMQGLHALPKAYKWLEKTNPELSGIIKRHKDNINSDAAHGGIIHSYSIVDHTDVGFETSFFDDENEEYTCFKLYWISDLCLGIIHEINEKNKELDILRTVKDGDEVIHNFFVRLKELHEDIWKGGTIKRILKAL